EASAKPCKARKRPGRLYLTPGELEQEQACFLWHYRAAGIEQNSFDLFVLRASVIRELKTARSFSISPGGMPARLRVGGWLNRHGSDDDVQQGPVRREGSWWAPSFLISRW